ncbi:hypothetical protein FGO68_gene8345 [Halteria grandinella]|uniref:Uncharacterized protein n=1 Tax=Halteria grandinella TaxID=5974 RepID=A0A8J8T7Y0_HALGN|nr:hypothetical protein FGO68_gene8345 [Halteria grandinella]
MTVQPMPNNTRKTISMTGSIIQHPEKSEIEDQSARPLIKDQYPSSPDNIHEEEGGQVGRDSRYINMSYDQPYPFEEIKNNNARVSLGRGTGVGSNSFNYGNTNSRSGQNGGVASQLIIIQQQQTNQVLDASNQNTLSVRHRIQRKQTRGTLQGDGGQPPTPNLSTFHNKKFQQRMISPDSFLVRSNEGASFFEKDSSITPVLINTPLTRYIKPNPQFNYNNKNVQSVSPHKDATASNHALPKRMYNPFKKRVTFVHENQHTRLAHALEQDKLERYATKYDL